MQEPSRTLLAARPGAPEDVDGRSAAMQDLGVIDHLLAFALGLALPLGAAFAQRRSAAEEVELLGTRAKLAIYWTNALVLALLGAAVVGASSWQRRPLAELGLRAPAGALSAAAAWATALVVLGYALDTWSQVATPARLERARARARSRRQTPFMPVNRREFAHSLVLCLAAGVGEEIVYRGYLIQFVAHFSGERGVGLGVAVLLPAISFSLAHVYQGTLAVLKVLAFSVGLGLIFAWTGSLLVPIAIHLVLDVVGMALSTWLMSAEAEA